MKNVFMRPVVVFEEIRLLFVCETNRTSKSIIERHLCRFERTILSEIYI